MLYSLGQLMEQLTVGWFVLQTTGSVFLTALAWAVRALPNLLFGSIGGAIADRYARNRVLAVTAIVRALNVCAMAAVVLVGDGQALLILALVVVSGLANTTQLASTQALAVDNADTGDLAHAISTLSFAARAMGALGVPCRCWARPFCLARCRRNPGWASPNQATCSPTLSKGFRRFLESPPLPACWR
jgi:nitrate/nitrite transporter NarK